MHVGLCLEKGPLALLALLAVLKAGGVSVLLDPTGPAARLSYMIEDAHLQLMLTQELQSWPFYEGPILSYEQFWGELQEEANANPTGQSTASHLAYIVYTSGSTGRPKGILSTHAGAVNYLRFLVQAYQLNAEMTVLQIPPLSFDASIRDIFGTLVAGGRLVLTRSHQTRDLESMLTLLQEHHVTHLLSIVPSYLWNLLDTAQALAQMCQSVRLVLLSGENLPHTLVVRTRQVMAPDVQVVNQYGPTETTMTATYYRVELEVAPEHTHGSACVGGTVPVGRPIANMQVYLLDRHFHPVPVGVAGEVYLGGPGLARGYLLQPDATAEKFVPHPFAGEEFVPVGGGERLYRTGDLARYRPDGCIEYLGRRDRQWKCQLCKLRQDLPDLDLLMRETTLLARRT